LPLPTGAELRARLLLERVRLLLAARHGAPRRVVEQRVVHRRVVRRVLAADAEAHRRVHLVGEVGERGVGGVRGAAEVGQRAVGADRGVAARDVEPDAHHGRPVAVGGDAAHRLT
jgi:hypothetical protein